MLRLDATVIRLSFPEVKAYGRTHQPKDHRRSAEADQLSTTASPKTRWQTLYEAIDSLSTYPSDRSPVVLPHDAFTAVGGFEVSTGDDNGGSDNHNEKKNNPGDNTEREPSVNVNGIMTLGTEQHTGPTGSTAILRPPLPPPFAATPRVSSPLFQPGTSLQSSTAIELNEVSHVAPPALRSPSGQSPTVTSPYGHGAYHAVPVRASLQRLVIYDDAVTATGQPQTPRNVPEARHQSRLHGSYTAPSTRPLTLETSPPGSRSRRRHRRRAGATSPAGMDAPGFVGLYGGLENTDEAFLYDAETWHMFASRRDL